MLKFNNLSRENVASILHDCPSLRLHNTNFLHPLSSFVSSDNAFVATNNLVILYASFVSL